MFVDMSHVVLVVCSRVPLDFASRVWEWKKFYAPTLDQEGGQPTKGLTTLWPTGMNFIGAGALPIY